MGQSPEKLPLFSGEHSHARIVLAIAVQSDVSMKRLSLAIALLVAMSAGAQSFEIGPRVSNYSTDLDTDLLRLRTGRVSSYGLVGGYRSGALVVDWLYDHDPENGISLSDLVIDVGDYTRDRGEVTVGFAVLPVLDLQGGVRIDQVRIGGVGFFGNPIGTNMDIDHQALIAGVRFHSATNSPAGFYLLARGMIGTAKFRDVIDQNADTTGYRAEVGIPIRLGESNWSIVPGAEYEHIEAKDVSFRMNTNRAFLNFVYSSRP